MVSCSAPSAPAKPASVAERLGDDEQVYRAITLALRDYVRKNGFRSVVIFGMPSSTRHIRQLPGELSFGW